MGQQWLKINEIPPTHVSNYELVGPPLIPSMQKI